MVVAKLQKDKQEPVTREEGEALAKELGAACYMECSSKTIEGLNEVFAKAVRLGCKPLPSLHTNGRKRKCVVL